ncbi:MAG: hypothetical protein ACRCYF_07730, partial [Shewanella sp.]
MIQSEPISFAVQIGQFSLCSQPQPQPLSFAAQVGQYSWCIALVSICLVFFGWRVAYNNAIKLATRSESKSIIDSISKLVTEISDLSLDFWLNKSSVNDEKSDGSERDDNSRVKENQSAIFVWNVLAKAQQVYKLSKILKVRGLSVPDDLLSTVHEKATLDCETAYKMKPEERIVRAQEIINACMQDIECLYESFQKQHPPAEA